MKTVSSSPITSWQIDEDKVEMVADFLFLGSKITVDGDCSHEIERCLLFESKVMTNLDSIVKSRTLFCWQFHTVKAMVFLAVMYGWESWTIKKAEGWRIDAFEVWCWRRLESPLDSKEIKPISLKGNQPWRFIGRTDAEIEAPILWPPDAKSQLTGKVPDAGKSWGQEKEGMTDGWKASLTQRTWVWAISGR